MKKLTSLFLIIIFLSCDNSKSEWLVLFDGKSVSGLRGYKMDSFPWGSWAIEDGSLKTVPGEKGIDIISMKHSKISSCSSNGNYNLVVTAVFSTLQLRREILSGSLLRRCRF